MKYIMHSWTYRQYPIEWVCRKAAEAGYEGLELFIWHMKHQEFDEKFAGISDLAKKYNLTIDAIDGGGPMGYPEDPNHQSAIDSLMNVVKKAKGTGLKVLNGGIGRKGPEDVITDEHYDSAAKALKPIAEVAEGEGVTLTAEIHLNTMTEDLKGAFAIADRIDSPAYGICLDFGNLYLAPEGEDPYQAAKLLGKHLKYVHFKNVRRVGEGHLPFPLADGDLDNLRLLASLKEVGYNDLVCVEYSGKSYNEKCACYDMKFIRNAEKELAEYPLDLTWRKK